MLAMSISEGRQRLFELRERVVNDCDEAILTHKEGNIVLISMDQWESYQETIRLFNDKRALAALLQSFQEHEMGIDNSSTLEEVFSDLL